MLSSELPPQSQRMEERSSIADCGTVSVTSLALSKIIQRATTLSRMAWWEAEGRYYGTQITKPVDNYVAGYVLLGIRLAVKEFLGRSAAKMVYSTTPRLPGEFTENYTVDAHTDSDDHSDKLRVAMWRLRLCPPHDTSQKELFQYPRLKSLLRPLVSLERTEHDHIARLLRNL